MKELVGNKEVESEPLGIGVLPSSAEQTDDRNDSGAIDGYQPAVRVVLRKYRAACNSTLFAAHHIGGPEIFNKRLYAIPAKTLALFPSDSEGTREIRMLLSER